MGSLLKCSVPEVQTWRRRRVGFRWTGTQPREWKEEGGRGKESEVICKERLYGTIIMRVRTSEIEKMLEINI